MFEQNIPANKIAFSGEPGARADPPQDPGRQFHKRFWAASSLDSAAELAQNQPGAPARVALAGYAAIQVPEGHQATDLSQSIVKEAS